MKTIKPLKLGVLHRTFENDGKCHFVPTFFLCFPFDAPDVGLQEANMWKLVGGELGPDAALDECMPKSKGEVLVTGHAYPAGGEPKSVCAVRVQIGSVDKQLYVIGDRTWNNGTPSDPAAFESMPVNWEHAFGGNDVEQNPLGKGAAPVTGEESGMTTHPLPNVEWPKNLVTSVSDRPVPASFSPIPIHWPQRMKLAGTYDAKWQKERYPGFPDDLDWNYFNTAAEDQRLETFFNPGQDFCIENMHPTEARIESRLPDMVARCFIVRSGSDKNVGLEEIPLRIDTVHLFPHRKCGVVTFRGVTHVTEDDAADVSLLLAAAERVGKPRPMSHYETIVTQRQDRERMHLYALRDSDLFPPRDPDTPAMPGEELGDMEELVKTEQLLQENMNRMMEAKLQHARDELEKLGVDPDEHLPKALPAKPEVADAEALPEVVDELMVEVDKAQKMAEDKQEELFAETRKFCEDNGLDFDEVMEKARQEGSGPPKFRAEEEFQKIAEQVEIGRNAGMLIPAAEAKIRDPEFMSKLRQTEAQLLEAYRKFAQFFPAASVLEGEEATRIRDEVQVAVAAGESLAGRDLTGADLHGMDLSGVNLEGAFLEAANLSNAKFAGANLCGAVLARSDLTDADFRGAAVAGVNLGEATLLRTDLSGGLDLSDAVFAKALMSETNLSDARLMAADFMDAKFDRCNFSNVVAANVLFIRTDKEADSGIHFGSSKFSGALLTKCSFIRSDLSGCDLASISLTESVFVGAKFDGAKLDNASCKNLRVVGESSMEGVSFRGASLSAANLRGVNLRAADFSGADLSGANLSEADLEGAKLYRVNAPGTLIMKANLKKADFTSANLMEANLQKSNIEGANFTGANLFRVDFALIKGNDATNFDGANMKFIRFVDRREKADG
jgi:uncharacterized protein YjbI with pentapeptide repeats